MDLAAAASSPHIMSLTTISPARSSDRKIGLPTMEGNWCSGKFWAEVQQQSDETTYCHTPARHSRLWGSRCLHRGLYRRCQLVVWRGVFLSYRWEHLPCLLYCGLDASCTTSCSKASSGERLDSMVKRRRQLAASCAIKGSGLRANIRLGRANAKSSLT